MTLDEILHEHGGLQIIPPLIRTRYGWAEQSPTPCPQCGATEHLVGWHACMRRDDTLAPGHRTWCCQCCDHSRILGCIADPAGLTP